MSDNEILEENEEVIVLRTEDGEEIEFEEVADINLDGKFYKILAPVKPVEGMQEDEALVFEVVAIDDENDNFNLVLDDDITNKVFDEYYKLLKEEGQE